MGQMCLNSKTRAFKAAPVLPRSPCCHRIPLSACMPVFTRLCAQLCVPLGGQQTCHRAQVKRHTCWYFRAFLACWRRHEVSLSQVFVSFLFLNSATSKHLFYSLITAIEHLNNLCSSYISAFSLMLSRSLLLSVKITKGLLDI